MYSTVLLHGGEAEFDQLLEVGVDRLPAGCLAVSRLTSCLQTLTHLSGCVGQVLLSPAVAVCAHTLAVVVVVVVMLVCGSDQPTSLVGLFV